MSNIDLYYKFLGLELGASAADIKQAYRNLAKKWHPDRFASDPQLQAQAEEKFKLINEAYVCLRERSDGDRSLQTKYYTEPIDPKSYYDLGVEEAERENYREAIYSVSHIDEVQ